MPKNGGNELHFHTSRIGALLTGRSGYASAAVVVLVSSGLTTIATVATSLVVPSLLTPDAFGQWRLFVILSSFSGTLHLGLLDGQFLNWLQAGDDVDASLRRTALPTSIALLGMTAAAFAASTQVPLVRPIAVYLAAQLYLLNLLALLQFYLQAKRLFVLNALVSLGSASTMFAVVALLGPHLVGSQTRIMLAANVVLGLVVIATAVPISVSVRASTTAASSTRKSLVRVAADGVRRGSPILASGLVMLGLSSADKLVVAHMYGGHVFGLYAFAGSVIGILLTVLSSLANMVLKYVIDGSARQVLRFYNVGSYVVAGLWFAWIIAGTPIGALVRHFLPAYTDAMDYLYALSGAVGPVAGIRLIQFSLYKSMGRQTVFFAGGVLALLAFAFALVLVVRLHSSPQAVAVVASSCYFAWYAANEFHLAIRTNRDFSGGLAGRLVVMTAVFGVYLVGIRGYFG